MNDEVTNELTTETIGAGAVTVNSERGTLAHNTTGVKMGNVFELRVRIADASWGNGAFVFNLADGYKPKTEIYLTLFDYDTGRPFNGAVYIPTNGQAQYYGDNFSNKSVLVHGTYFV